MKKIYLHFIQKTLAGYASILINKFDPYIVAITGSVGKTMTKEAVFQVLHDQFGAEVLKNEGNLNSAETGLALSILGYKEQPNKWFWPFFLIGAYFRTKVEKYPKYLVLELGIDKPGDMEFFTSIIKPNVAIITSLTGAHLKNFKNLDQYIEEKLKVLDGLKPSGITIVNCDDNIEFEDKENVVKVGIDNSNCAYSAEIVKVGLGGTDFRINCTGHKIAIKSHLIGSQLVYPSLFAFAVADKLGIQLLKVSKSLEKIMPVAGRMSLIEGKNAVVIIDDTYNANPTSVKAGLLNLSAIDYPKRKIAILGNMNELGSYEEKAHAEVGEFAKGKCDLVIFVGPNSEVSRKAYGDDKTSLSYPDRKTLIKNLDSIVKKGDLVYVKASQNNNYFEEVVKSLMLHPEQAPKLLVRQSKSWLRKK